MGKNFLKTTLSFKPFIQFIFHGEKKRDLVGDQVAEPRIELTPGLLKLTLVSNKNLE